MVDAAEIGLFGDALWSLSSVELQAQFKGAKQRLDGLYELGLWIAWHTALFTNAKKLPALGPLLQKLRQKGEPESPMAWRSVRDRMAALRTVTNKQAEKTGGKEPPARRKAKRG